MDALAVAAAGRDVAGIAVDRGIAAARANQDAGAPVALGDDVAVEGRDGERIAALIDAGTDEAPRVDLPGADVGEAEAGAGARQDARAEIAARLHRPAGENR